MKRYKVIYYPDIEKCSGLEHPNGDYHKVSDVTALLKRCEEYMFHTEDCLFFTDPDGNAMRPCTCGLDDLLAELRKGMDEKWPEYYCHHCGKKTAYASGGCTHWKNKTMMSCSNCGKEWEETSQPHEMERVSRIKI